MFGHRFLRWKKTAHEQTDHTHEHGGCRVFVTLCVLIQGEIQGEFLSLYLCTRTLHACMHACNIGMRATCVHAYHCVWIVSFTSATLFIIHLIMFFLFGELFITHVTMFFHIFNTAYHTFNIFFFIPGTLFIIYS